MNYILIDFPEIWEGEQIGNIVGQSPDIPTKPGIYCILYHSQRHPEFIDPGTGGFYKDEDPNVSIDILKEKWVMGATVLYIGKTDGSLKERICTYMKFGQKKRVAHHGGRYIWQIKNSGELVVCWKALDEGMNPRQKEAQMIDEFKRKFGKLPFANLRG